MVFFSLLLSRTGDGEIDSGSKIFLTPAKAEEKIDRARIAIVGFDRVRDAVAGHVAAGGDRDGVHLDDVARVADGQSLDPVGDAGAREWAGGSRKEFVFVDDLHAAGQIVAIEESQSPFAE